MSKEEILQWFSINSANLDIKTIIAILGLGLILGIMIFLTYKLTYKGVAYNAKFNASNVVILLITIVIMLMISSNIVISLGMVGALSIVRFRTSIRDPRDTVFIFFSIVEGLCVGSMSFILAITSTLFICAIICAFSFLPEAKEKYLIILKLSENESNEHMEVIKKYQTKSNIKSINYTEYSIEKIVEIKSSQDKIQEMAKELTALDEVKACHILNETGETLG